ncbi:ParB/Srx family N-terminal domain-containing protein [Stenotrophomonas maltophilia]|uniref:ParB/Srx family N-terminal domain-containing protein n=1 Tax=Stenotrophomonas maltophilia TaxID=40324 RepID=UPI0039C18530
MTRSKFELVTSVPVKDLLLDVRNARIRSGADQADCISRIASGQEEQLVALASDIAEHGLSTAPILAKRQDDGRYVVWDGNRRVTALKLLDNPSLAPSSALRRRIEAINARFPAAATQIDLLQSQDEGALVREVVSRHGGGLKGAGQLDWSALMRTFFMTSHGLPEQNRRAAALFLWADDYGVSLPDDFPITTIMRFLTKENLLRLGFEETSDGMEPRIPLEKAIEVAQRLADDFRPGGPKQVNDVFNSKLADAYIAQVRVSLGLDQVPESTPQPPPVAPKPPKAGPGKPTSPAPATPTAPDTGPGDSADAPTTAPPRPRAPPKPTWDRDKLFRGGSPGFSVPKSEVKVTNILAELRKLKTRDTPLAVSALFRMLVELSTTYYYENAAGISDRGDNNHKRIAYAAKHMFQAGLITEAVKEQVLRRTTEADGMLQYNSLNQYMHTWSAHPDFQQLHVLWDELELYLKACWSV